MAPESKKTFWVHIILSGFYFLHFFMEMSNKKGMVDKLTLKDVQRISVVDSLTTVFLLTAFFRVWYNNNDIINS